MTPLVMFLLGCVAVYLGSIEAAFSALMRLSLRLLAERSDRPDMLGKYLEDPLLLFIPIRLLLGVVTTTATAFVARAFGVDGADKLPLVILSVVGFVVLCELVLPLLIVGRKPERILELLLPSFAPIARGLAPMTGSIARAVRSATRVAPPTQDVAAEEAHETADPANGEVEPETGVEGEERQLLKSIVDFGDTLVREVMTPRPDIVAVREDATVADVRALFREQEYSRFPVYKESLDNIAGFVFIKDFVALAWDDDSRAVRTLLRPASVVPETKRVPELLRQFQEDQTQIAIVVDEYGGTAGLVTVEDLLEELVGEIRDEYDVESELIVEEGKGRFVFSGKVAIGELIERLDVDIDRQGFETVGGYLLAQVGRVPMVGERFELDGLTVEVLEAERRRVRKVRVFKQEAAASMERAGRPA
ncbi:MAG: HlyC/CorC family transporter [Acidobacteria bacterium]|nr:HlyC/CorC family transporter [Acidobacteriota bacterium]